MEPIFFEMLELDPNIRFEGLTIEQVKSLYWFTYDETRSPIVFSKDVDKELILKVRFFNWVVQYLQQLEVEQPLRLTQKGNLPRAFCQGLVESGMLDEIRDLEWFKKHPIQTELEVWYIHIINLITYDAGLTWKKHGKLRLTKKGSIYLHKKQPSELFLLLVSTYVRKLNWAYADIHGPDAIFIQEASGYSLHLVQQFGHRVETSTFYSDMFLKTFPRVLELFAGLRSGTPMKEFEWYYYNRTFRKFLGRFGLVEIGNDNFHSKGPPMIRRSALFDEFIRWKWKTQ